MKSAVIILTLILFSLTSITAQKEGDKITFTTKDGKEYKEVKLKKISPDSILISHSGGMAKIPYEKLPQELATKIGFDPKKAALIREAQVKSQAAFRAQMATRLRALAQIEAKKSDLRKAELRDCYVDSFVDDGIIFNGNGVGNVLIGGGLPRVRKNTRTQYDWILKAEKHDTQYHLKGIPSKPDLFDDSIFSAYMIPDGTYKADGSVIKSFRFVAWVGLLEEKDKQRGSAKGGLLIEEAIVRDLSNR